MTQPLITVENLQTHFFTDEGTVKAVEDVSLRIDHGKTLGLVGESGCGKSVTALSIIRLISRPGKIVGGNILFHDQPVRACGASQPPAVNGRPIDLTTLSERDMRKMRGSRISMIFQEPMTSLNPVFSIGWQITEAIRLHEQVSQGEAKAMALEMLKKVNIPAPERRIKEYPHQFSGGMRQRAMIAMALACHPSLLIADEPTTALDVTIQAQILELLKELQRKEGMSILMITHDLGIIAELADDVAVMYASKVAEYAPVRTLYSQPRHPYTQGLFESRPEPGKPKDQLLTTIPGMVPSPLQFPGGCKFHPRCPYAEDRCRREEPRLREIGEEHRVACHFAEDIAVGVKARADGRAQPAV